MSDQTMEDSDDEFDRLSDLMLSDPDSEDESEGIRAPRDTPATTPPSSAYHDDVPRDKQKRFVCTYENCAKAFNRPARLEDHLRSHTNDRAYRCPYSGCSASYLRDGHLKHHVKSAHTKVREYKCTWEGCDKSFITGTRLRTHLAAHEGREKYRCRGFAECNQTFRKKDTLQRHVVAVHLGAQPFPCPADACDKAFDTAEHLRQHQRTNHNPYRYSCTICLEAIEMDTELSDLGKQEGREAAYFSTYSLFETHKREVHPPTCVMCDHQFPSVKALSRHLELEHDITNRKTTPHIANNMHVCNHCGKNYSSAKVLTQHIAGAHQGLRWTCGPNHDDVVIDGKSVVFFKQGTDLDHVQGTNHEVVGCDDSFSTKASLVRHIKIYHWGNEAGTSKKTIRKRKASATALANEGMPKKARKVRKDKGVLRKKIGKDLVGADLVGTDLVGTGYAEAASGYAYADSYNDGSFGYTAPPCLTPLQPAPTYNPSVLPPLGHGHTNRDAVFPVRMRDSLAGDYATRDLNDEPDFLDGDTTLFGSQLYTGCQFGDDEEAPNPVDSEYPMLD